MGKVTGLPGGALRPREAGLSWVRCGRAPAVASASWTWCALRGPGALSRPGGRRLGGSGEPPSGEARWLPAARPSGPRTLQRLLGCHLVHGSEALICEVWTRLCPVSPRLGLLGRKCLRNGQNR